MPGIRSSFSSLYSRAAAALVASALTAAACTDVTGPPETVASVVVVAPATTVTVGVTLQLAASVLNSNGVAMAKKSVEWTSVQPGIASVSSAGVVMGLAAGTVTIHATSGMKTGSITLEVRPAVCSAASTTGAIGVGQSVTGGLGGTDCVQQDGRLADGWVLTVSTPTTLRITMASTQFDALLLVTDQAMNVVAADDDGGGNFNARVVQTLAPGTYIVWATSFSPRETGAYSLSTSSVLACGSGTTVGSLVLGQAVSGNLAGTDCVVPPGGGASDGWTLTISEPTTLRIELASGQFDPFLFVTDQAMNHVTGGFGGPASSAQILHSFVPGTYIVWASSYPPDASGAYTLTTASVLRCAQDTAAGTIEVGQTVIGAVEPNDCFLPHGRPGEGWSFTVDKASALRFAVQGTGLFPVLLATGTSAELPVFAVSLPTATGSATILQNFPPGEYLLWVTTADTSLGSYELSLTSAVITSCDVADGTISVGQNITSALSFEDCQLPGGQLADLRQLTLAAPANLQIDLVSSGFDAYLMVRDQAGNVIAADDDGGGFPHARIAIGFPAGTYTIVATSFGAGETGSYRLSVQPAAGGGVTSGLRQDVGLKRGVRAVPSAPSWLGEWAESPGPTQSTSSGSAGGRGGRSKPVR